MATLTAVGVLAYYWICRRRLDPQLRPAVPYFWLVGLSALYEYIFTFLLKVDATVYFRIYGLLDILFLLYFYGRVVRGQRLALGLAAAVYLMVWTYLWIHFEEYDLPRADQILVPTGTVFVFYFTICWFRQKFLEMRDESLLDTGAFYFVSAVFIYNAATLFLFLYGKLVHQSKQVHYLLEFWVFNIFMVVVARLILLISIWKARRT